MISFWGSERGRKVFDIFVDDVKVGTQELNNNDPDVSLMLVYLLPTAVTAGKKM